MLTDYEQNDIIELNNGILRKTWRGKNNGVRKMWAENWKQIYN